MYYYVRTCRVTYLSLTTRFPRPSPKDSVQLQLYNTHSKLRETTPASFIYTLQSTVPCHAGRPLISSEPPIPGRVLRRIQETQSIDQSLMHGTSSVVFSLYSAVLAAAGPQMHNSLLAVMCYAMMLAAAPTFPAT